MKHYNPLFKGNFGLEKENLRVSKDGKISSLDHKSLFNEDNPYIVRDFAESQIEMITQVHSTINDAYNELHNIQHVVLSSLEDEYLWPQSNPPLLDEEELIKIAQYEDSSKQDYRNYLSKKYGSKRAVISGIHFNMSFDESVLQTLFSKQDATSSFVDFKNTLYLKILKYFLRDKYIFTNLFAASPIFHDSFIHTCVTQSSRTKQGDCYHEDLISLRNSQCGYTNREVLDLNYSSLKDYDQSIQSLIGQGLIQAESEVYESVRLKRNTENNIEYLEFRFIDINPFIFNGVSHFDLEVLHMFMLYYATLDDFDYSLDKQKESNERNYSRNTMHPEQTNKSTYDIDTEHIKDIFNSVMDYMDDLDSVPYNYKQDLNHACNRLINEEDNHSRALEIMMSETSYLDFHLNIAKKQKEYVRDNPLELKGYETLELSTKILIQAAIKKGILVEVLDSKENFISLNNPSNNQTEYVKQATKTSLDNYSSVLVMENKAITKDILSEHHINVPKGFTIHSLEEGKSLYTTKQLSKSLVIKPNNTNFGLGITIFEEYYSLEQLEEALELALSYDETVILESFQKGLEFRFLVIDQKVEAVLHRTAANVIGDGVHTIQELIDLKNQDSRRSEGYVTPLEIIKIDDVVIDYLKSHSMTIDFIPDLNQQVFLRKNSNISTGGDSIDYTDQMHESYIKIAEEASKVLNVNISGVDIIIEDYTKEATSDNYSILEVNFNPAIHIHNYPYIGENREIGLKIINALFKEDF